MKVKVVLFGIEDVLYDSLIHMSTARLNAVRAMIEDGLPTEVETTYKVLEEVVDGYGLDYTRHFDELLKRLGLRWNPRVIASGVVAYRETSSAYLRPFPDTVPTLLGLRDKGYRIAIVSAGRAVKQWQKLVQLGLKHLFHEVIISEELGFEIFDSGLFREVLDRFSLEPQDSIFVGSQIEPDIAAANNFRVPSIRISRRHPVVESIVKSKIKPLYEIERLSEIFTVIDKINSEKK